MKKKNIKLGKLKLSKSSVASLEKSKHNIVGGVYNDNTFNGCFGSEIINGCNPHTMTCPPPPTQWPECGHTDIACGSVWNVTACDCNTNDTVDDTVYGPKL